MPRLSAFHGIVIYMYTREHGVAHFHARHGDREAVIEIATGDGRRACRRSRTDAS